MTTYSRFKSETDIAMRDRELYLSPLRKKNDWDGGRIIAYCDQPVQIDFDDADLPAPLPPFASERR